MYISPVLYTGLLAELIKTIGNCWSSLIGSCTHTVYCKTWNMEWNGMESAMNKIILHIFI